jgi:Tfp pilus assembly PilM family ATPase
MTVRDLVKAFQQEIQRTEDLQPDRAAELLNKLTALIGNVNDEIRAADSEYAVTLLHFLETEQKANRARIRAEISPEYRRKQEARDTKELVVELSRSLKYYLKAKQDEFQMARHQA